MVLDLFVNSRLDHHAVALNALGSVSAHASMDFACRDEPHIEWREPLYMLCMVRTREWSRKDATT